MPLDNKPEHQPITVVTATNRLAHETIQAFDQQQLKAGKLSWESISAASWRIWVQTLWTGQHRRRTLLADIQLKALLKQIIKQQINTGGMDPALAVLWNYESACQNALDAWTLVHEWDIDLDTIGRSYWPDHYHFKHWAQSLRTALKRNGWISSAELAAQLSATANHSSAPLRFTGFDRFTPAQQALLDSLGVDAQQALAADSDSDLDSAAAPQQLDSALQRHEFVDATQEWQHIGAWARQQLSAQPNVRLAVITPDLQSVKALAQAALAEQLSAANHLNGPASQSQNCFHFSLGQPLANTALVASALNCLSLLSKMQYQQVGDWLLSPYWGAELSIDARASVELKLRERLAYTFDLFTLTRQLRSESAVEAAIKAKLEQVLELKKSATAKRSYRQWVGFFSAILALLDWPKSGLNSHEHQTLEAWNNALDTFGALDLVSPAANLGDALSHLTEICHQSTYQDQANPNTQIHIMGVLEAGGLSFDGVWLSGFNENAWPPKAQLNPFIPLQIQREKGIPEALPEVFLQAAQAKLSQLLKMAPSVTVSHASTVDDIAVAASPMLAAIKLSAPKAAPFNLYQTIRSAHGAMQSYSDDIGLALETDRPRGGAGLIQAQANCAFQAYASYRLLAQQEGPPEPGTDQRTHGTLIHEILQSFWAQTKTQSALLALMDSGELESTLEKLISPAITKRHRASGLHQQFDLAQGQRIKALLLEWLDIESGRPGFSVVEREQQLEYALAGLNFRFIIDRIDKLENESGLAVIDYKTGASNTEKDWCSARPSSPQLPLYALAVTAQSGPVDALAYGQIHAKNSALIGLCKDDDLLPGLKPPEHQNKVSNVYKDLQDWEKLIPLWQGRLEQLAADFRDGQAQVDPKDLASSCQYCPYTPFCRIKELSADRALAIADEDA